MMTALESFSENYKFHSILVLSFPNEAEIIWVPGKSGDLAVFESLHNIKSWILSKFSVSADLYNALLREHGEGLFCSWWKWEGKSKFQIVSHQHSGVTKVDLTTAE